MKPIWILIITVLIILVVIVVIYLSNRDSMTNDNLYVEEHYFIKASEKRRVANIDTSDAKVDVQGDLAHHDVKNHYFYLKPNVPYNVKVTRKSNNVIWSCEK